MFITFRRKSSYPPIQSLPRPPSAIRVLSIHSADWPSPPDPLSRFAGEGENGYSAPKTNFHLFTTEALRHWEKRWRKDVGWASRSQDQRLFSPL